MSRVLVLGLVAVVAAAAATPANAGPRRPPLSKKWTATAPAPDPTNFASQAGQTAYSVCNMKVPQSFQIEKLKVLGQGKLTVDMTNFHGDWDILLMDSKNKELAYAGLTQPLDPQVERIASYKIKKPGEYQIVLCNWAGGPTADGKYLFTYT